MSTKNFSLLAFVAVVKTWNEASLPSTKLKVEMHIVYLWWIRKVACISCCKKILYDRTNNISWKKALDVKTINKFPNLKVISHRGLVNCALMTSSYMLISADSKANLIGEDPIGSTAMVSPSKVSRYLWYPRGSSIEKDVQVLITWQMLF